MRILDTNTDIALKNIILYLRAEEAKDLHDSIGVMLENKDYHYHDHVNDATFEHEVTVVLYDEQQMESLNERSKEIILKDI